MDSVSLTVKVLMPTSNQGLTLVHVSAQPEPFLTQNTPQTPSNSQNHHLETP